MSGTTIKTNCPVCGEVSLTSRDITLNVHPKAEWNHYRFECPTCHEPVEKAADEAVINALATAGVVPKTYPKLAGYPETKPVPHAPMDEDYLIEFGRKLHLIDDIVKHAA